MSSFSATFKIDGKEFDVISCSYSFGQNTDEKGRPSSSVFGGHISLQISAPEDDGLLSWMIDPYKKSNGSVVFNKIDQDSTMKELKFEEGYLVSYGETFHANSSDPMAASLNISARKISVGNSTHEMKW
jgi:hypothetical protein